MANWVLAQQLVLCTILAVLMLIEKRALRLVGPKLLYQLWFLVPLVLVANNLPQNMLQFDNQVIYQTVVNLHQQTQNAAAQINWPLVWLVGATAVLAITAYGQWQVMRLCQPVSKEYDLPLLLPNNLKVYESANTDSPAILGIWPAKLLLPVGFQQKFDPLQQRLILQHELVHFRRFDNLYNLLAISLVMVFWFNPLVWLAYGAFRRSQELACDATVLVNSSRDEKISYSKALLICAQPSIVKLAIYSQYGAKQPMLNRINLIKSHTKNKRFSSLICAIGGMGLLTGIAMANQQGSADLTTVNQAEPIVRVEPKYPLAAAQQNIEGSVVLQFDIGLDGSTSNIKVVKAVPEQVFDKNSIAALQKWRYKPQIVQGKPQVQQNLLVQLDYRLNELSGPIPPLIEGIKILN